MMVWWVTIGSPDWRVDGGILGFAIHPISNLSLSQGFLANFTQPCVAGFSGAVTLVKIGGLHEKAEHKDYARIDFWPLGCFFCWLCGTGSIKLKRA
jgi:hypothetical protein